MVTWGRSRAWVGPSAAVRYPSRTVPRAWARRVAADRGSLMPSTSGWGLACGSVAARNAATVRSSSRPLVDVGGDAGGDAAERLDHDRDLFGAEGARAEGGAEFGEPGWDFAAADGVLRQHCSG